MEENKESLMEPSEENAITEIISINVICRLCANQNDKLIGIFSENGLSNDLASKMNLYLPVKVYETDELPLQCCWQCASTVLAWHDLFLTSLEADRRLRSYQFVSERQLKSVESYVETDTHQQQQEDEPEGTKHNVLVKNESEQIVKPEVAEYETSNESLTDLVTLEPRYLQLSPVVYEMEKEKTDETDTVNSKPEEIDQIFEGEPEHLEEKETTCYGCQTCQMVFLNEQEMVVHLSEVHPEEDFKPNTPKNNKKDKRKNTKIDQDLVNSAKIIVDGKIYYNCKECGRCLHSPYTYVWHMRIHTGERPHTCHLCGKCFRVSQGLVRHLKETHQGIKNFPCDLCGRMFATRRNVEEHRRIHTNERPYVCDLCGKSFKQKASLFVHNRSHTDSFPFKCSYCEQMFRTKPPLMIHITKHTGEKPYPCDICGRHFRIKYELKRHRLIHSDEKPFACVMCGLSFKQKRYLKNHNKQNHSTLDLATDTVQYEEEYHQESSHFPNTDPVSTDAENPNITNTEPEEEQETADNISEYLRAVDLLSKTCKLCERPFTNKTELKNHMFSSHNLKQPKFRRKKTEIDALFCCPECRKRFTRKFDMQKHLQNKHPDKTSTIKPSVKSKNVEILEKCKSLSENRSYYTCDVCNSKFGKSSSLMRHRSGHFNEKPYCCHICGAKFRMSAHLTRHIDQLHHDKKRFSCMYCDLLFKSKPTRDEHLNIHTQARPFMCDVCGKAFKQKASLYVHKKFHKDVFPFSCNVCGKKYRRKSELKVHQWIHSGERPYSCDICKKSFRLGQDLKRHYRTHATYTCGECNLSFDQMKSFKAHKKLHENTKR